MKIPVTVGWFLKAFGFIVGTWVLFFLFSPRKRDARTSLQLAFVRMLRLRGIQNSSKTAVPENDTLNFEPIQAQELEDEFSKNVQNVTSTKSWFSGREHMFATLHFAFNNGSVLRLRMIKQKYAVQAGLLYTAHQRAILAKSHPAPTILQHLRDRLSTQLQISNVSQKVHAPEDNRTVKAQRKKVDNTGLIKRIWVWGERCSCTTTIVETLLRNFKMLCDGTRKWMTWDPGFGWQLQRRLACVYGGLPWKHGFLRNANTSQHQEQALHILVTRHPYEWVDSLRRTAPHMNLHKMQDMDRFLTMESFTFDAAGQQDRIDRHFLRHPPNVTLRRLLAAPDPPPPTTTTTTTTAAPAPPPYNATPAPLTTAAAFRNPPHRPPRWPGPWVAQAPPGFTLPPRPPGMSPPRLPPGWWMRMAKPAAAVPIPTAPPPAAANWRNVLTTARAPAGKKPLVTKKFVDPNAWPDSLPEALGDRDPDTGQRFPTILAMRERKLRDWLRATADAPATGHGGGDGGGGGGERGADGWPRMRNWAHVACRDYLLDPGDVLDRLHRQFRLLRAGKEWDFGGCVRQWNGGVGCDKRRKARTEASAASAALEAAKKKKLDYYLTMQHMRAFNDSHLAIINAWLDPQLEERFGYKLFKSVAAASVPYNNITRCAVHGTCS